MIRGLRLCAGALLAIGLVVVYLSAAEPATFVESDCTGVINTDALGGLPFITFLDPISYGCRVVDAVNGHPVHDGTQSVRVELHADECNSSPQSLDCQSDRSRYEVFHNNRFSTTDGKVSRYEEWVYVPPQVRFRPRGGNIMFLNQMQYLPPDNEVGGTLAYLEVGEDNELMVRTHVGFTFNIQQRYTVLQNPVGVWTKVVWEIGGTTQANGFLRVYINDVLKVDETKPTLPSAGWRHSLKIGIYNAFRSQAIEPYDTQVVYFDAIALSVSDFSPSLIQNGDFSSGEQSWSFFATPTPAYIVHQVTNGVLEYYRVPPPPGTANQAVAFQETGVALPAGAPILAQFNLANTSTARKRVSVLTLDFDFSDLSVCTFWLEPGATARTYRMRSHTTRAWTNAALYFYAASAGSDGGFLQIDNVSLTHVPTQAADRTDCVDPTAPVPAGGPPGSDLLVNGDFSTGTLPPWGTFGQIQSQIANGVFEFVKLAGTPAGVVLQPTGQAITTGERLTATFQLGNSSSVRKRVTVILHDNNFSDLSACTFWLPPGQALSTYTYRTFATHAWTNATLSVYPATTGPDQWIQLDNVTLQRTPAASNSGTECVEPGGSENPPTAIAGAGAGRAGGLIQPRAFLVDVPVAPGPALRLSSWLSGPAHLRGRIEISRDGETWETAFVVPPSDTWMPLEMDLSAYAGTRVLIRFVVDGATIWWLRAVR